VRVATYNIRHGQGVDGRLSIRRVAEVVAEVGPTVVGMQEVWRMPRLFHQASLVAEHLGMHVEYQEFPYLGWRIQGNALLSAAPILGVTDLRLPGGIEARGALVAEFDYEGFSLSDDEPATYPARSPRKALDHVLFSRHWRLASLTTVASVASDHRPLVADLELVEGA